jgi:HK97 family phage prohead protease
MQIEIRADGAHISGYVNVTEKKSRPVITPHGKVIEEIEPRAFQGALDRAENVPMTKDHDPDILLAETRTGNLKLYEDEIGLHYDAVISDEQTVAEARAGKVRGLSFGMLNVVDTIEERANDIPLRKITRLDLDHITLVVNKCPVYAATSCELRADSEIELETRTIEQSPQITEIEQKKPDISFFDNSAYQERINKLKK